MYSTAGKIHAGDEMTEPYTTDDLQNTTSAQHKAICREPEGSCEVLHVLLIFSFGSMNAREEYTT